jgi:hypothetical protein
MVLSETVPLPAVTIASTITPAAQNILSLTGIDIRCNRPWAGEAILPPLEEDLQTFHEVFERSRVLFLLRSGCLVLIEGS